APILAAVVGLALPFAAPFFRRRPQVAVDSEHAAVGPHVGRIDRDHEGQIAHEVDAAGGDRAARAPPLLVELPLRPLHAQDVVAALLAPGRDRAGAALARAARPVDPALLEFVVPGAKERVVVEPGAVLLHERDQPPRAPAVAVPLVAQEARER